jgi:hypothetical protein
MMTWWLPRQRRVSNWWFGRRPLELVEPRSTSTVTGSGRVLSWRWERTRQALEQNRAGRPVGCGGRGFVAAGSGAGGRGGYFVS